MFFCIWIIRDFSAVVMMSWLKASQFTCNPERPPWWNPLRKQRTRRSAWAERRAPIWGFVWFCWKHLRNQLVTSHGLKPCWGSCTIFGSSESTSFLRDLHAREVSARQRQKPRWQCEWNEENGERTFGGQMNFLKVTFPRFEVLKVEL